MTPVLKDKTLYVGCHSRYFYALNMESAEILWRAEVEGGFTSPPLISYNLVYLGGRDGNLYSYNLQ